MKIYRFGTGGCLLSFLIFFIVSYLLSFFLRLLGSGAIVPVLVVILIVYYFRLRIPRSQGGSSEPEYTIVDDDEDEAENS